MITFKDVAPLLIRRSRNKGNPFCITALTNSAILMQADSGDYYTADMWSLEYKIDNGAWTEWTNASTTAKTTVSLPAGSKMYIRRMGEGRNPSITYGYYTSVSANTFTVVDRFRFRGSTGTWDLSGDMTTLLETNGNVQDLPDRAFASTFSGNPTCVIHAHELVLPATVCSDRCYWSLFYNCTSLTTAPALPATTLAQACYQSMFTGCSRLNWIEVRFTNWYGGASATNLWVSGVQTTSGTFRCKSALPDTRGHSGIPNNWTIEYID